MRALVEDSDYLMDNPGDHVWSVDTTTNSSVGRFFNVPNRMSEDEFLAMCRRLNSIQRRIFLHTLYCLKTNKQFPCISILEEVLESLRVL